MHLFIKIYCKAFQRGFFRAYMRSQDVKSVIRKFNRMRILNPCVAGRRRKNNSVYRDSTSPETDHSEAYSLTGAVSLPKEKKDGLSPQTINSIHDVLHNARIMRYVGISSRAMSAISPRLHASSNVGHRRLRRKQLILLTTGIP